VAALRPQALARAHTGLSNTDTTAFAETLADLGQLRLRDRIRPAGDVPRADRANARLARAPRRMGRAESARQVPASTWLPSVHRGQPLGAWYWNPQISGAASGPLTGQDGSDQGQRLRSGRADDERHRHARGLRARGGRHHRYAYPRRRRHHPGKGGLRAPVPFGWQPHQRRVPSATPYDLTRSTGGSSSGSAALVAAGDVDMAIGGIRAVRCASQLLVRHVSAPTYVRPGAVHRCLSHRAYTGPCRPDCPFGR
jgi:hypothetical protein